MDAFAATRFAVGTGFLVVAAASDLRTRRVRDPLWIALGTIGLVILGEQMFVGGAPWPAWSLMGSAAVLFYAVFFGRPLLDEDGFHPRGVRIVLFIAAATLLVAGSGAQGFGESVPSVSELASMPIMVAVYQGFYRLRLLHGGADAKGLIALTLLVPSYPDALPFPVLTIDPRVAPVLRVAFPFSLGVWVDAAIVSLAVPLVLLIRNAIRGDVALPQALLGYRARIAPFPKHAWLMERITARGEHVLVLFPKRGRDPVEDLARLRAAGVDRAWVTPQTPFMVPLALGYILAFVVGNLLIGLLQLV